MRSSSPRSAASIHRLAATVSIACLALASACHAPRSHASGDTQASVSSSSTEPAVRLELGFDRSRPGEIPSGFSAISGTWIVRAGPAERGNVVAQTAESTGAQPANLLLLDNVKAQEVDVAVKLHAVRGELDQGGGVVWRVRDARNYYLARWNPLDKSLRVHEVIDGERKQLASGEVRVEGAWHELRVTMKGEQIRCSLDGRVNLSARDKSFSEAGRVGLWTHADAETEFDDLRVLSTR